MEEQANELRDLKEGHYKKDQLIIRLTAENAELLRFKDRTKTRLVSEGVPK